MYFNHTRIQKMVSKWASQLITQIWRLIYRKWLHRIKVKNAGEVLDDHAKEFTLDAKITDEY